MAGREVARALACMSLKQEDCTSDLEGLTESQLNTLKQWEARFNKQYPVVGHIVEGMLPQSARAGQRLLMCAFRKLPRRWAWLIVLHDVSISNVTVFLI